MTEFRKKQLIKRWEKLHSYIIDLGVLINRMGDDSELNRNQLMNEIIVELAKVQEEVIQIGEGIERMLPSPELTEIVTGLELFCEDIYKLSQSCDLPELKKLYSFLLESHNLMSHKISNINTKRLAIFMPYKYSMWDSLESVYLAAKSDSQWEAVVVPIPYANRAENDSIENVTYEGNYFTDIEVVDFDKFSMEYNHPDVVYVHNPYDDNNSVTTVLPEFYSYEIKRNAEKVVYIPYFFAGEIFPDMHCNLPSYSNFDYIVVPSECAAKQVSAFVLKEKVLALGSPKIDCMLSMSELKKMPNEWRSRIRDRKVVLYNNSLNSIINLRFHGILKMRQVFDYFKKNQEMVLWWRPHPLLKSTLKSMCPELLGAYEEIEKAYLKERIGIYDITQDSNRAVACADAFLGDPSSMQNLFGILGKPIFLLDDYAINIPEYEDTDLLYPVFIPAFTDTIPDKWVSMQFWTTNGETLFWDWSKRSLYAMTRDCRSVRKIKQLMHEVSVLFVEHADKPNESALRIYPRFEKGPVLVYRINDNKWETSYDDLILGIELEKQGGILERGDCLFILPGRNPELIIVNNKTGDINRYSWNAKQMSELSLHSGETPLLPNGIIAGNKVYMLSSKSNIVLSFDVNTYEFQLHRIGNENTRLGNFWYVNDTNCIWFVEWNGQSVIRWNLNDNKIDKFPISIPGYYPRLSSFDGSDRPAYFRITWWKDDLILVPCLANMFIKINMKTGDVREWKLSLPFEIGQRKSSIFSSHDNFGWSVYPDDTHMLVQSMYDGSMILINMETDEIETYKFQMSEEEEDSKDLCDKDRAILSENGSLVFWENAIEFPLYRMMNFLSQASEEDLSKNQQRKASTRGIINADGSCGKSVHSYMNSILQV